MNKVYCVSSKLGASSDEEFKRHVLDVRGPLVRRLPGLRAFTQYFAVPHGPAAAPLYDGVTLLEFESPEAMQAACTTPEGIAALGDAAGCVRTEAVLPVESFPPPGLSLPCWDADRGNATRARWGLAAQRR